MQPWPFFSLCEKQIACNFVCYVYRERLPDWSWVSAIDWNKKFKGHHTCVSSQCLLCIQREATSLCYWLEQTIQGLSYMCILFSLCEKKIGCNFVCYVYRERLPDWVSAIDSTDKQFKGHHTCVYPLNIYFRLAWA